MKNKSITLTEKQRLQLLEGFKDFNSALDNLQEIQDLYLSDIGKLLSFFYDLKRALKFNSNKDNRWQYDLEENISVSKRNW
jgi:hypothetical protein